MAEQGTDMAEQRIDYVTKHALMQLFNARAEILDRFGLLTGDPITALVAWSRAARAISEYQMPAETIQEALRLGPVAEEVVADVEARWICNEQPF